MPEPPPSHRGASSSAHEVTRLLDQWSAGKPEALEDLFPLVYGELRSLAAVFFRNERAGHTLQPTALVHEAYFRLTGRREATVRDRTHFFALAAQAMRRILVDHARRQHAAKRIGAHQRVPIDDLSPLAVGDNVELLELHEALKALSEVNARQAKVIELRFFGGMSNREAAEILGVAVATVERDWRAARLWLHRAISS
jgi:RNA polymerase sigma factor (TIGR02999 family)